MSIISKVQSEECCLNSLHWQRQERRSKGELGEEKRAKGERGEEHEEEGAESREQLSPGEL